MLQSSSSALLASSTVLGIKMLGWLRASDAMTVYNTCVTTRWEMMIRGALWERDGRGTGVCLWKSRSVK